MFIDTYIFFSSAKMQQPKSSWSSLGPSQMDSSLLNNIQKLFSEKIDLSGTIEPNRASIVMAIIKTCLKVHIILHIFYYIFPFYFYTIYYDKWKALFNYHDFLKLYLGFFGICPT